MATPGGVKPVDRVDPVRHRAEECVAIKVMPHLPLNEVTVLEYFSQSQFYKKDCNNERARSLDATAMKDMQGIEYAVVRTKLADPNLMVIEERYRYSSTHTDCRAVFYVLQGVIYQAPDLHVLLSSRLHKASFHLRQAISKMSSGVRFDVGSGHRMRGDGKTTASGAGGPSSGPGAAAASGPPDKKQRVGNALQTVVAKRTPPS